MDYPLTELGKEQAKELSVWVKENFKPEIIISSPLKRASETANIINSSLKCKIDINENLKECSNGILAGMKKEDSIKKYPLPEGGWKYHQAIEGGESQLEFRKRIEFFWNDFLLNYNSFSKIIIVAHGGTINMLYRAFFNLPLNSDIIFPTSNTGLHFWKIVNNKKYVVFSNRSDHLKKN